MQTVAVMDSGIGGLTVLNGLRQAAPQCDFLYLADHAHCPYGTKSAAEICKRAVRVASFLKESSAVCIVIACNTASVFCREIRQATRLPVLDVIRPTCSAVIRCGFKRVALLATAATVRSGTYQNLLARRGVETVAFPCSEFVPLVEQNACEALRRKVVEQCLKDLPYAHAQAVILGCTHFPYLQKEIATHCGTAQIISCERPVAEVFARQAPSGTGTVKYLTTGTVATNLQPPINFEFVNI